MKKIFLWAIALIILVMLSGCGEENKIYGTDDNLQTPTSTTQNTKDATSGSQENTYDATDGIDTTESPHVHSYTASVVVPTCTTEGYTTYTCNCGDSYVSDKTASVGHVFGEWHTTKEPTSTSTGVAEKVCENCNVKETKVLGKIAENHTHCFTSRVTETATCNQEGETTFSCTCGETYTEVIAKTNHTYKTSVTKPTCVNEGYTKYSCSCGDSYVSDKVDPLGHTFSEWKIIGAATTPETETAERVCSICNTRETKTLAHNHNYTSTITLTALCNREGTKKYSCASCGNTYTEAIPKLSPDGSHTYNEGQIISSPTCASNGKMKYTCIHGDMYYYETIPATGKHDYSKVNVISKATCTSTGFQEVRCANCYDWYRETLPALGHDYDSGVVTTEAHCLWEGEKTFTCSRCKGTHTETIPKLSHAYGDGEVLRSATCLEGGLIEYTCACCGEINQVTTDLSDHNYVDGRCTVCGGY